MPAALAQLAQTQGTWDYHRDYLDFPRLTPSHEETLQRAQEIARLLAEARRRNPPPEPARGGLYDLALRLQRAPMLSPVMRAVPQGLRFRIKRLLSR
jgi:hypothetical protein